MKNKLHKCFLLSLLALVISAGTAYTQNLEGFQNNGSFAPDKNSVTTDFQINGYTYDAVHFLNVWNSIPGHGIAINPPYPRVNITGLRGYGAASGVQQVVSVTNANIFSTKSTICLPSSSALNGQGQVVSYAYTNIVEAQIATFTHRITGRPSNAPRGRQRAR